MALAVALLLLSTLVLSSLTLHPPARSYLGGRTGSARWRRAAQGGDLRNATNITFIQAEALCANDRRCCGLTFEGRAAIPRGPGGDEDATTYFFKAVCRGIDPDAMWNAWTRDDVSALISLGGGAGARPPLHCNPAPTPTSTPTPRPTPTPTPTPTPIL